MLRLGEKVMKKLGVKEVFISLTECSKNRNILVVDVEIIYNITTLRGL